MVFCRQDYKLENIKPVDMFPHTYHIESVAKLARTQADIFKKVKSGKLFWSVKLQLDPELVGQRKALTRFA